MTDYNEQTSLDTLLLRHHVTLTAVYDCAVAQLDNLNNMEHIFDLENEKDAKLLVTIPVLLFTNKEAKSIIDYFKNEERENKLLQSAKPDLEKYKVLLLSAFVYNPSFFSMAWNWCAYIQEKVRKQQGKPNLRIVKSQTEKTRAVTGGTNTVDFPVSLRMDRRAAASAGNNSFGKITHLKDIGELKQLVKEEDEHCYFQFSLKITNERLLRPFTLEIDFTTLEDGKEHHTKIDDNPNRPRQTIRSEPMDIAASQGIEIRHFKFQSIKHNE